MDKGVDILSSVSWRDTFSFSFRAFSRRSSFFEEGAVRGGGDAVSRRTLPSES
jgi:hypothetical protein